MSVRDEIEARLRAGFDVREIEVVDDSASHAGHAGAPAAGESHFNVMLRSADLAGLSRVARHRAVHKALGDIVPRIHALALDLDA
ncbi:BolA/IbaG family iron-sulfur metabolism protein [uncultured Tateyamaria sp.]|uniref:BolA family protein n=1 Tax=Tateyamaria sp. 1078 TaxID=3417464 RepID=UPI002623EE48|nr:BolA/IbaG family iron-sulfur metabolism protein [uncultured Tateyamaria sp.]